MGQQVSVSREIKASPEALWAMVSDVTRMGEWSPETQSCVWLKGAAGPAPGARFNGHNQNGKKKWDTVSTVVDCDPGRTFSFRAQAAGLKIALWTYTFEPTPGGCAVTETWTDERGAFVKWAGKVISGVAERDAHNRTGMEKTLERLAAAAEGSTAAS
jgi:uncharacterized protein YndB with AHSA1/START domain